MKKIYYLFIFIFSFSVLSAQEKLSKEEKARREKNIQAGNPFAQFGYKAKIATLSKGKYLEFHDLDSIVTIGTVRWHVYKNEIVGRIVQDSLNPDAQPIGDRVGRWISPDPLSEEFPSWSPYNMCYNNPVKFVDPDGRAASPVYDPNGNFLGTDETGLKGMAVVMNKSDFTQGMSTAESTAKNLGQEGFKDDKAMNKAYSHFAGLEKRPDYDGYLTLSEANNWFQNGKGEPLFVDASKIDLSPVETADFSDGVGSSIYKNFFLTTNQDTGRVYGTIKLTLDNENGTTTLGGKNGYLDTYNFEQKKSDGTLKRELRNFGTKVGEILAGKGIEYKIFNYGKGKVEETK
ncbi:MAG: RHS repeat domain-containing protein [Flavobacterium sp.]